MVLTTAEKCLLQSIIFGHTTSDVQVAEVCHTLYYVFTKICLVML